jgi:hypothetical protein
MGGTGGTGGVSGSTGGAGSSGAMGVPCTSNLDCPADAICCDGSDPRCDGVRLPSGDGTNPGEFVVSTDDLTVADTITSLVWQRDGSSVRAGCTGGGDGRYCTWDEAQAYCASLVLGGLSGWRLPAWMELLSTDFTSDGSTIDQPAFPHTPGGAFWTSTPYTGSYDVPFCCGYLQFNVYSGYTEFSTTARTLMVRCVRGSRCYPASRFVVLDGGLVRDALTGLVWQQQGASTKMTWPDAQGYCSSLGSGFRLPTLKEIDSIVDPTVGSGPTLRKVFLGPENEAYWRYWTSSECSAERTTMRCSDFSHGYSNSNDTGGYNCIGNDDKLLVRCVR